MNTACDIVASASVWPSAGLCIRADIATLPAPFILVLDDYHVIHEPGIHRQLGFLVEHQPPQVHLVIITREDPPLPIARLRARGQMVEIRQEDLRFSLEECAGFLNQVDERRRAAVHDRYFGRIQLDDDVVDPEADQCGE